jgi:hypothetical protein
MTLPIRFILTNICLVVFCCALGAQETTGRVHAVIISGGMNKLLNHERYWNDCAFLYRTLRHDYHYAKDDITLLISDGGDDGRDMLLADGSGFASSPSDLDGDGERDVWLPATLTQVETTLAELAARLSGQDRLLLFMMDHGGSDGGQSHAWMWGGERLTDSRLAQLLDAFRVASMTVVMGMCHSGGFISELWRDGRIILTSCGADEQSWACSDKPYDEFVYHWTCAMAGHDPEGHTVSADADGDGQTTIAEAFDYVQRNDTREETPQYYSTPAALGGQWTLAQPQRNAIITSQEDRPPVSKCYDLQGQTIGEAKAMRGKYIKKINAKQSFRPSPIIIIK